MAKDKKDKNDKIPPKQDMKSLEDILRMDGLDDVKFDKDENQKALEKLEQRKKLLDEYKLSLNNYKGLGNEEYKLKVLKELVEKGLVMMETMKHELEDNPRGADVEYVSSLMNAINSVIDSISKMDFFKEKVRLEQEKMNMKERLISSSNTGNITQNNMYVTTNDIIAMIKEQSKTIDINIEKETNIEKIE